MKINSHCWLRTALQRLQCVFIIFWKYWNKRHTPALIRGRRLITFLPHVRRLMEGGAYSGAALIRENTVMIIHIISRKLIKLVESKKGNFPSPEMIFSVIYTRSLLLKYRNQSQRN